jgi:hypothetical protein
MTKLVWTGASRDETAITADGKVLRVWHCGRGWKASINGEALCARGRWRPTKRGARQLIANVLRKIRQATDS